MAAELSHRERVERALKREEIDRIPVSMWRHFYDKESSAQGLAEAMLAFQRKFEWDFMKVNPRASYHAEGWGDGSEKDRERLKMISLSQIPFPDMQAPVQKPEDWAKIEPLPIDEGALAEQLESLELISAGLNNQVPFIMTVFNPLSVAGYLVSSLDVLLDDLRNHPDKVMPALEAITDTFIRFSRACLDRGASGLLLATCAWATKDRLTVAEYNSYARPYDIKLLNSLEDAEFNLLHVCRDNNMLETLGDYPVQAFNWDTRGKGNPTLEAGKTLVHEKFVVGGLPHREVLMSTSPTELHTITRELAHVMGSTGWALGAGCTYSPEASEENIVAIRSAVEVS